MVDDLGHVVVGEIGLQPGDLPVCDTVYEGLLSLPMFPEMTREQVARVSAAISEWMSQGAWAAAPLSSSGPV